MTGQIVNNSKAALSAVLSLAIAFGPTVSYALNVQVQKNINLRTGNSSSGVLQKVGSLAAGSIVSIPDEYAVKTNGSVDFERTLNNWLSKASKLAEGPGMMNFTESKKDYFFPIKVVKAAPGSQVGNQESYMIALHYLQRKGSLLETTEEAPIAANDDKAQDANATPTSSGDAVAANEFTSNDATAASSITTASNMEASAPAPVCLECLRATNTNSNLPLLATQLQASLDNHLAKVLRKMGDRTIGHVDTTIRNFEKKCYMRFNDFLPSLRTEIANSTLKSTVPNALSSPMLLGLMTQETTGDCNARGDHGRSVGAFQAQSNRYTKDQLRNPVTSVRAAIDNLETQKEALDGDFDFSRMTETDRMRIMVSAYNGGPKWVIRAKQDLLQFNRQQGASLDYNKWEDLRIFYFRRALDSNSEYHVFGTVRGGDQRSKSNALKNLAYTENLLPRYQSSSGYTLQEAWNDRLGS